MYAKTVHEEHQKRALKTEQKIIQGSVSILISPSEEEAKKKSSDGSK